MIEKILYGFAGSALFGFIYLFFFAQREKKIRSWLRKKRAGWLRRKYVWAFIGAIRGDVTQGVVAQVSWIAVLLPFTVAVYSFGLALRLDGNLTELATTMEGFESSISQEHDAKPEAESANGAAEAQKFLERARAHMDQAETYLGQAWMVTIAAYLWFLGTFLLWRPFVLMRSRFDSEVKRARQSIRDFASSKEVAEIALMEARVCNEPTLKRYVEAVTAVTKKYEIQELSSTFELWD